MPVYWRILLSGLVVAGQAAAQDIQRIEDEKAGKFAALFAQASGSLTDLPVRVEADLKHARGVMAKGRGALVVPDRRLSVETLKAVDKAILPVGVLYLRLVTPVVAGQTVAPDQHRVIEVNDGNNTVAVAVLPLAAARLADRLVLLVYTGAKSPPIVTSLVETDAQSDWPLEIEARPAAEDRADLILTFLGRYRASIQVAGQN